jgi:DNA-binding NarL/FixJ family response regulator
MPAIRDVVIRFLDPLLRDTVARWVDSLPGYQVAGAVEGSAALIELCTVRSPDVAVVQVGSAETAELTLLSTLCGVRPNPHVVGLHPALDPKSLLRLHRAGANRLVSSRLGLPALRAALGGPAEPTSELSQRQLEILGLIAAGCTVVDIATALEISAHTVTNHKRHIFAKLNVHSRAQAAAEVTPTGRVVVMNSLVRAGYLVAAEDVVRPLLTGGGSPRTTLTRRERDILASIARGHSVGETAHTLGIAIKTVHSLQRQLFSKLGARNRLDALTRARTLGLVDH